MSSGLPPSGGRIQALLTLLLALFGPPAVLISFAHSINLPTWLTIVLVLVYEILALFVSFLTEVWEKLKQPWVEALANRIDQRARSALSHYHHHYCRYFVYEYRDLDVKGITTQGVYTLDLEDVFIELRVDPKAPHETSTDPLHVSIYLSQVPAELRSGSHTFWEYLVTPYLRNQHFVMPGPPGSGKTTLLKYLGLALVHRKQPHVAQHFWHKLPVLLFLREHSKAITDKAEYTLADAIREGANRWKYSMPPGWIEHRLARGQCLILLDGLDEVADATQRQQAVNWVERQMRNYGNNRFVLTSRPFGYRENPLAASVTILEVQPLTFQQATQFIMNWYCANEIKSAVRDDAGVRMKAEQGARDLLRCLRETPDLFDLIVNPLLLTMIATIHRYRGTLPCARIELYKEICEVFLGKRQMARGIVQDLRAEQRQLVLQPLAYEMMLRGVRTLDGQQAEQFVAAPLQQVSATPPHDFLESIQNTSGLLLEREHGVYSFAHKTFQEYLAAVHINKHGLLPILMARVQEEWWHETIRLYCAQADATPLIEACLRSSSTEALILALECEREALSLQTAVQRQVEDVITEGIEGTDSDRRRITTEALLARRLRQMYALNEQTFIDTTLVTHAEYQLFLNEMHSQGKDHQPDHWTDFTFPADQGRQPVLGVRHSDAQAFCAWLSERGEGVWRYRLPDGNDLARADQGIQKALSQDTGYWTEGERRFVWSQEQPSSFLSTCLQATITRASENAGNLALPHDLAGDLAFARVLTGNLVFTHTFALACPLALALACTLSHERDLGLPRIDALDLDLAHALADYLARIGDLAHVDAGEVALDIYIHLFLLQERRARRLSAWEGILLVKERTIDV